ncbi:hypothetical protein D1872_207520 [compost metagenome]
MYCFAAFSHSQWLHKSLDHDPASSLIHPPLVFVFVFGAFPNKKEQRKGKMNTLPFLCPFYLRDYLPFYLGRFLLWWLYSSLQRCVQLQSFYLRVSVPRFFWDLLLRCRTCCSVSPAIIIRSYEVIWFLLLYYNCLIRSIIATIYFFIILNF